MAYDPEHENEWRGIEELDIIITPLAEKIAELVCECINEEDDATMRKL